MIVEAIARLLGDRSMKDNVLDKYVFKTKSRMLIRRLWVSPGEL